MKVALLTDAWRPQVNGVVTTLSHVMAELRDAGHESLVIEPGMFRTMSCPSYPEISLALLPGRKISRLLETYGPDAIHIATEGPIGLAGRSFCRSRGLPFTTSYHTQFPLYLEKYAMLPRGIGYRAMRWFHGRAERTLVPTHRVESELREQRFTNVVTWSRGVDTEMFHPGPKNHSDRHPIFLYVGRAAREKNIDAFLRLNLPGTKWVVGDGPELKRLRTEYPDVRFFGFRYDNDLAGYFRAADVFVFPSRTDTYGVVMLEAMASGLPVAAYPVTGPVDVVKPGVTGVLHDDLAVACLEALKLDPAACRQHALENSWSRCAEQFLGNLAVMN